MQWSLATVHSFAARGTLRVVVIFLIARDRLRFAIDFHHFWDLSVISALFQAMQESDAPQTPQIRISVENSPAWMQTDTRHWPNSRLEQTRTLLVKQPYA